METGQTGDGMKEVARSVERCVGQAGFHSPFWGRFERAEYRQHYLDRGESGSFWRCLMSLEPDVRSVSELADSLEPVLEKFWNPGTGLVGTGTYVLFDRSKSCLTLNEFARVLVRAAILIGEERVLELLAGWVGGEPLRFQSCALLHGLEIDEPLHLPESIHLVPGSDVPRILAHETRFTPVEPGDTVLSVESEIAPALFMPGEEPPYRWWQQQPRFSKVPDLTLDTLCESLSLACGGLVDWHQAWRMTGDLAAFSTGPARLSIRRFRPDVPGNRASLTEFEEALRIHRARGHADAGRRSGLDTALRHWMRSGRTDSAKGRFGELRIALGALYGGGMLEEFRVPARRGPRVGEEPRGSVAHLEIGAGSLQAGAGGGVTWAGTGSGSGSVCKGCLPQGDTETA